MEALCWAFHSFPSRADEVIWGHTEEDIRCQVKIKLGFEVAKLSQDFEQMSKIVSAALGGEKSEPKPTKNLSEARRSLDRIFNK